MLTRGFIEKIRMYFDELGVEAKNGISFDDFQEASIKTLNHCEELSDTCMAIDLYNYCAKKWNSIEKIFTKKIDLWRQYNFENASNIHTVSSEVAQGTYYVTNALTKKYKDIYLSGTTLGDKLYSIDYQNGKFTLGDGSKFYLKYAKTDACIMKLFNQNDQLICNIVLSDNLNVFLEKNKTNYELVIHEEDDGNTFIGVFEKSYVDSLGDNDYLDFKYMVADIEWDLLNKKSDLGVAKITQYKEVKDNELLFYFGISTFLLYKSFSNSEKRKSIFRTSLIVQSVRR